MLKLLSVSILCLLFFGGTINYSFAGSPTQAIRRFKPLIGKGVRPVGQVVPADDYQADIDRVIALRSRPLDELIALGNELEAKWRKIDWNLYAGVMRRISGELSSRDPNDSQAREESEHFARIALSHSSMYSWEHEAGLVGLLGYERSTDDVGDFLRSRREKTERWLHALRRLENETDPTFDINDRKNRPMMRVFPPFKTGLPPGTPPSAIKDPHLRAEYEKAIAENKRKSEKVDQQLPLLLHGPSFRKHAEQWLVGAYSQQPLRKMELKRYLDIYLRDDATRQRILSEVDKNSK